MTDQQLTPPDSVQDLGKKIQDAIASNNWHEALDHIVAGRSAPPSDVQAWLEDRINADRAPKPPIRLEWYGNRFRVHISRRRT